MSTIISIHEYVLKPGVDKKQFEKAIQKARERGLLKLPGLEVYHFVKGIKGSRNGHYATVWIYESREAWQRIWGTPEQPVRKEDYPENWKIWEKEILMLFLDREPDKIEFTAYEELG
jgi:hypothetical protein